MIDIDSQVADQSAELPVDENGNDEIFMIRSLNKDPISRFLLTVIAICGIGLILLLVLVLAVALSRFLGINLPVITAAGENFAGTSLGFTISTVLAVTALLSYLLLRHRVLKNPMFYASSGCPKCWENELVRIRRFKSDRLISRFGISVHRYTCRNCDWSGLRVGGQLPSPGAKIETSSIDGFWDQDEVLNTHQNEAATGENT
jgi:predicted RNA-binding Zn-ribbon protein involved in translation (DUF1610 family)